MELKNKVVVITGGTGGIAICIIKKLLNNCNVKYVGILELDLPECRNVFENLQKDYGEKVGFYPCDVTNTVLISEIFDKIVASHGTIDILINNAGISGESRPEKIIDINLKALIMASYALIDRIGKHKGGKGGIIVNIASILGLLNLIKPAYCAAKHGVVSFTRTMKDSYDTTGVSVVAMCPGKTDTPILLNATDIAEYFNDKFKVYKDYPTQSPENVAAAVINLIENGECGDVWVSENEEPPYSVGSVEDYKSLKIKDYPA